MLLELMSLFLNPSNFIEQRWELDSKRLEVQLWKFHFSSYLVTLELWKFRNLKIFMCGPITLEYFP